MRGVGGRKGEGREGRREGGKVRRVVVGKDRRKEKVRGESRVRIKVRKMQKKTGE